jgi:hypothetical protein
MVFSLKPKAAARSVSHMQKSQNTHYCDFCEYCFCANRPLIRKWIPCPTQKPERLAMGSRQGDWLLFGALVFDSGELSEEF